MTEEKFPGLEAVPESLDAFLNRVEQELEPALFEACQYYATSTRGTFSSTFICFKRVLTFLNEFSENVRYTLKQTQDPMRTCYYHTYGPHDVVIYAPEAHLKDPSVLRERVGEKVGTMVERLKVEVIKEFDKELIYDVVTMAQQHLHERLKTTLSLKLLRAEASPAELTTFLETARGESTRFTCNIQGEYPQLPPKENKHYIPDGFHAQAIDPERVKRAVQNDLLVKFAEKKAIPPAEMEHLNLEALVDEVIQALTRNLAGILITLNINFSDRDRNPFLRAWSGYCNHAKPPSLEMSGEDMIHQVLIQNVFYSFLDWNSYQEGALKPWGKWDKRVQD